MALKPVPSRRSTGSARATIRAFCESVKSTGPIVVSPPLSSSRDSCRNAGVRRCTANSYVVGPAVKMTLVWLKTSGIRAPGESHACIPPEASAMVAESMLPTLLSHQMPS